MIYIKKLIKKYRVTYNIIQQIFVVNREYQEKPNSELNMHESGLHCYNPNDNSLVLINTVYGNTQGFTNRKISGAE